MVVVVVVVVVVVLVFLGGLRRAVQIREGGAWTRLAATHSGTAQRR